MSAELDELRDLTRALRRRASLSDASDWTVAGVTPAPAAATEAPSPRRASKAAPKPAPVSASTSEDDSLETLAEKIHACRACPLGATRIQAVPGVGSAKAQVMFIGEGPGFQEDHKGEPFIGRSGQLLDKIIESIGLSRKTVYIANIVKCHPMKNPADPESHGNDRPPTPDEMAACRGWLEAQIRAIKPKVIVTLGAVPAKALLGDLTPITKIRGRWRVYEPGGGLTPIKLLPTFHPAALLRNPDLKRDVWMDMKNLQQELAK